MISRISIFWTVGLVLLLLLHAALLVLSFRFVYGSPMLERPIVAFVGVSILAGFVYLGLAWSLMRRAVPRTLFLAALATGVVIRAAFLFSAPALEDDYYRYLWDGAVLAQGINPYRHSPAQVSSATVDDLAALPDGATLRRLQALAARAGPVFERINHPHLRTIYPPVAQGFFAAAHGLAPWSLLGWRLALFIVDLSALALLSVVLRRLGLPAAFVLIYWLNPLLLRDVFMNAHMDVLVVPFLVGALALSHMGRNIAAAACLALAAGVKLWPVLLLPLILWEPGWRRGAGARGKEAVDGECGGGAPSPVRTPRLASVGAFVVLLACLLLPVLAARLDRESGFVAYAQVWEMNDGPYMIFRWALQLAGKAISCLAGHDQAVARGFVGTIVLGVALRQAFRGDAKLQSANDVARGRERFQRALVIVAVLFLLSPTQFPWYSLWFLPLLAVRPSLPLLLLTPLLSVYYLRFQFKALDRVGWFDNGVVWIQYIPVLAWLAVDRWGARRAPLASNAGEGSVGTLAAARQERKRPDAPDNIAPSVRDLSREEESLR